MPSKLGEIICKKFDRVLNKQISESYFILFEIHFYMLCVIKLHSKTCSSHTNCLFEKIEMDMSALDEAQKFGASRYSFVKDLAKNIELVLKEEMDIRTVEYNAHNSSNVLLCNMVVNIMETR